MTHTELSTATHSSIVHNAALAASIEAGGGGCSRAARGDFQRTRLEVRDAVDDGGRVVHDGRPRDGAEVVGEEVRVWAHAAVLGTVAAALFVFGAAGRKLHKAGGSRGNAAERLDDELN